MTLDERAAAYSTVFPKYPSLWFDKGWLMGVWVLGALYKRQRADFYGAYPGNYLKRVYALFPDRIADDTLHLFSGTLQGVGGGVTVDINPALQPAVVADAKRLPFPDGGLFSLIFADPPYSAKDAENYGTPMISRRHVVAEARRVVHPGAHLCWLDTVRPMYSKRLWKQVGAIMVLVSTNTRTRCLSIFEAV